MERETKLKVVDLLPVHLKLIVLFSLKFYQSFRRNITLAVTLSLLCSNTFELKAAHKKRMRSSLGAFFFLKRRKEGPKGKILSPFNCICIL